MSTCPVCAARHSNRGTISDTTPPDRGCRDCETHPDGQCWLCRTADVLSYCAECGCGYGFPSDLDDEGVCRACRLTPGWWKRTG